MAKTGRNSAVSYTHLDVYKRQDGTNISTPYGINVNPYSGNIYITDAYDYTVYGDCLLYTSNTNLET